MDQVKISLIIPVYNVEKYIEKCLNSVIGQTVAFDEVLIIDDGSTDDSLKICKEMKKKHKEFQIFSQENRGLGYTRNRGTKMAKGDYIMFLDSDDELGSNAAACLKEILLKEKYDVIYFNGILIDKNGIEKRIKSYREKEVNKKTICTGKDYFEQMFPRHFAVMAVMAVYRKKFLENCQIAFQEEIFYEDNLFTIKTILESDRVLNIDDELYIYKERAGSITQSLYTTKKMKDLLIVADGIYDYVIKKIGITDLINTKWEDLIWGYYLHFFHVHNTYFAGSNIEAACCSVAEKVTLFSQNIRKVNSDCIRKKIEMLSLVKEEIGCFEPFQETFNKLCDLYNEIIDEKLKMTGLGKEGRIGIYGIGKHTQGMIEAYEKRYGKIKADLEFYTTEGSVEGFYGKKVFPIKELSKKLDALIISSFIYKDTMEETIKKVDSKIPIIKLYNDNDYSSIEWKWGK